MNDLELLKKAVKLIELNPSIEVKVAVDNEFAEEFGWTVHEIKSVELTDWILVNDRFYTDEDIAKDEIAEMLHDYNLHYNLNLTEELFEKAVDDWYKANVETVVCIETSAI